MPRQLIDGGLSGVVMSWDTPKVNDSSVLSRTVVGLRLRLRVPLHLEPRREQFASVVVISPSAELRLRRSDGGPTTIGRAVASPADVVPLNPDGYREIEFVFDLADSAVASIDALRSDKGPEFDLVTSGSVVGSIDGSRMDTLPARFHGSVQIGVPLHDWIPLLRGVGLSHAILFEVRPGSQMPPEFVAIWKALEDAETELRRGGPSGWRGCVAAVRHALELWAGVQQPTRPSEGDKSIDRRIDELRLALRSFTNEAHHSTADRWTRADAVVALSTVASLLARQITQEQD